MASSQATITVRVTPRSGRDEVMGRKTFDDGVEAVCVRVTAPPDGGKANKAVCKAVAASLGVPKSSVEVVSGATARRKQLAVDASQEQIEAWFQSLPQIDA